MPRIVAIALSALALVLAVPAGAVPDWVEPAGASFTVSGEVLAYDPVDNAVTVRAACRPTDRPEVVFTVVCRPEHAWLCGILPGERAQFTGSFSAEPLGLELHAEQVGIGAGVGRCGGRAK